MLILKTRYQKLSRVCFAPDGRGLAAAGNKGAYWWRSVFDDPRPARHDGGECGGVGFTPDGGHLLFTFARAHRDTEVRAIDLVTGEGQAAPLDLPWPTLTVCPRTGLAVVDSWTGAEMTGWAVGAGGAPMRRWAAPAGFGSVGGAAALGPGGAWFVRPGQSHADRSGTRYDLVVHDAADGRELRTVPAGDWVSCPPAVSPDGALVAYGSGGFLRVRRLADGPRVSPIPNDNTHQFTAVAFHPGRRFLAATNNDATVKLFDTATWELARTFTWEAGRMRSVCFSPDGTLAAAGSDSGKVVVWDVDL